MGYQRVTQQVEQQAALQYQAWSISLGVELFSGIEFVKLLRTQVKVLLEAQPNLSASL